MAINKVVYDGSTLIDLSNDTLSSADQLLQGIVAHDRTGAVITGTATGGGVIQDQDGYIVLPSAGSGNPTLITKSITQNGTYDAEDDNADGYSSVAVSVSGGGSELTKIGTVTKTYSSNSLWLIGGVWKDSQGNYIVEPVWNEGSQQQQFDLYAPNGTTGVKIFPIGTNNSWVGQHFSGTGSVSYSTYYITISGDCSLRFEN